MFSAEKSIPVFTARGVSSAKTAPDGSAQPLPAAAPASGSAGSRDQEIAAAARDLAEYQRLTAEGKLAEAGERLQSLKGRLERLAGVTR